jgi:hypothetical protein
MLLIMRDKYVPQIMAALGTGSAATPLAIRRTFTRSLEVQGKRQGRCPAAADTVDIPKRGVFKQVDIGCAVIVGMLLMKQKAMANHFAVSDVRGT